MAEILIASMQPVGHFGPLLNVASGLVARGDRVSFLTASHHAAKIRAIGAKPCALPPEAEFDESRLDIDLPGRTETTGIKRVNFDIEHMFLAPMPYQAAALTELMRHTRFDAIIVDHVFFGIVPFLLGDPAARPPVLSYSTTPLTLSSSSRLPRNVASWSIVSPIAWSIVSSWWVKCSIVIAANPVAVLSPRPLPRRFFHSVRLPMIPARTVCSSHSRRIAGDGGVHGAGLNNAA